MPRSKHTALFMTLASTLLAPIAIAATPMPPTVDPTYGLPLPIQAAVPAASKSASQWIWAANTSENQTVYLRRTFALDSVPKTATLYLTADDFFTLFVNGKQVDQSVPDPMDINVWQHVHVINIAPYLNAGRNVLAARALNAAGAAGFIARLEMPGQAAIETDPSWKLSAAAPADDWTGTSFDDGGWQGATVIAPLTGGPWAGAGGLSGWPGYEMATAPYLAHITLPFAAVTDVHPGGGQIAGADGLKGHTKAVLTVTPSPTGAADPPSLLLDFGKEIAGRIRIEPLTGGTVIAATGESDDEALKSPWGGPHSLTLTPGNDAFTPYSAFRYVHLTFPAGTAPGQVRIHVAVDHKYYPVQYKGTFACSDPLLTKLWYTGAYTAHLCMQEDIWDAPKRDRARWIGDLHVSGEVINDVFADKFLMEQTMTRLRDDAQGGRPDTELPVDHVNGIPGYSCAWICCLADFHRHIGDYVYLNKQHDRLITLLEYMKGELDENNLFADKLGKWPYVDWSPGFDGDHPLARATTQLFYVKAAREAVFLLGEMNDKPSADKYAAWADALTAAARQYLPDSATNTYSNRLQENAMAVYSGVATPAQQAAIYSTVLTPDSPSWDKSGKLLGNNPVLSPYYGNYIIAAMSQTGHTADTMRVLRDCWGGMLAEGATTFWEGYDPKWPKAHFHEFLQADNATGTNASLCHGWSAGPTSWLTDHVLGVQPTSGGFRTAEIVPDLGDLAWAEGDVPTPQGLLHVRAAKNGAKMTVNLIVPPGVSALVGVPGSTVTVNEHSAKSPQLAAGRAFVPLTAGKYTLVSGR
ncbi:MAG: alpha-L-rhamnosidase C-terminal domain-containing protein [Janthinobacterium lividum]